MKRFWIKLIACLPLAETTVLIKGGRAIRKRGDARSVLLYELTDLAKSNNITDACIHAASAGNSGHRLSFYGIPRSLHQRFRNVWSANWR